jgi:hypothetical protein
MTDPDPEQHPPGKLATQHGEVLCDPRRLALPQVTPNSPSSTPKASHTARHPPAVNRPTAFSLSLYRQPRHMTRPVLSSCGRKEDN